MKKQKSVSKWVEVPCKFWVSATSQEAFDEAVRRIPGYVWLDTMCGFYGGAFTIMSEKAKKKE